jgi:hypothetical protein
MEDLKEQFQRDEKRLKEYGSLIQGGPLKLALDFAILKNTPERFEKNSLCGNDSIVSKAAELDQMTGWNDAIKFMLSLAQVPKPKTASQVLVAYDDDYVEGIEKLKGNPV